MANKRLLVGMTGSFCNHQRVLDVVEGLKDEYDITFVLTHNVSTLSTRFFEVQDLIAECERISGKSCMTTLTKAELVGPKNAYDMMLIAPCSAHSLARFVHGLYDCPVALCAKAMIRNQKNIVFGIASNDILGISGVNVMQAMNMKHCFFIPFAQDMPIIKPRSCVACFELTRATLEQAMNGKQIQPVLRGENEI